jgi:DNA-binding XRE family transcriptional regulator
LCALASPVSPHLASTAGEARLASAGMKKPKRKKDAPRKATAIDAYIGERMRTRRHALEMSQEYIAKALDVSKQQIQKYEAGQDRVSAARLFGICSILKVSLSSMFERDPKA